MCWLMCNVVIMQFRQMKQDSGIIICSLSLSEWTCYLLWAGVLIGYEFCWHGIFHDIYLLKIELL